MDKKPKTVKNSFKSPPSSIPEKSKKGRISTGRSPKYIENTAEQKYAQLSKSKKLPLASKRDVHKSALPFDSPVLSKETEKQQLKLCQSNISYADIPVISSEKTIKMPKSNEKPKGINKLVKQKRKTKWFRDEKIVFDKSR